MRLKCTDQEWFLGAPNKTRLFELWFGSAEQETDPYTAKELEALVGAKGPNAFKDILPRLISVGLVKQISDKYQPIPFSELSTPHQEMRHALEVFLSAIRRM
jgi:hypothetical protein